MQKNRARSYRKTTVMKTKVFSLVNKDGAWFPLYIYLFDYEYGLCLTFFLYVNTIIKHHCQSCACKFSFFFLFKSQLSPGLHISVTG